MGKKRNIVIIRLTPKDISDNPKLLKFIENAIQDCVNNNSLNLHVEIGNESESTISSDSVLDVTLSERIIDVVKRTLEENKSKNPSSLKPVRPWNEIQVPTIEDIPDLPEDSWLKKLLKTIKTLSFHGIKTSVGEAAKDLWELFKGIGINIW